MNNRSAIILAAAGVLLVANNAYAQGYIGASFGQSDVDVSGYDQADSYQIFGGLNLSQFFGVELAYTNLGKFDLKGAPNSFVEVDGFEVTAVGSFPVAASMTLFGEAGLYVWNMDAKVLGVDLGSDNGSDLTYGIGAMFQLIPPLRLHIEYQRYNSISDGDIDTIYGGVAYSF